MNSSIEQTTCLILSLMQAIETAKLLKEKEGVLFLIKCKFKNRTEKRNHYYYFPILLRETLGVKPFHIFHSGQNTENDNHTWEWEEVVNDKFERYNTVFWGDSLPKYLTEITEKIYNGLFVSQDPVHHPKYRIRDFKFNLLAIPRGDSICKINSTFQMVKYQNHTSDEDIIVKLVEIIKEYTH